VGGLREEMTGGRPEARAGASAPVQVGGNVGVTGNEFGPPRKKPRPSSPPGPPLAMTCSTPWSTQPLMNIAAIRPPARSSRAPIGYWPPCRSRPLWPAIDSNCGGQPGSVRVEPGGGRRRTRNCLSNLAHPAPAMMIGGLRHGRISSCGYPRLVTVVYRPASPAV
jgi:hypothetical protein